MDKRYQVFVSSTFEDLQEERKEVMQALLELDCIPAGMELFPASNESQWDLIKRVIDDSDYYILIIGGRYGSTNDEGKSFTQMEYEYAVSSGKPVLAFLHKNPDLIPAGKTENTDINKKKLEEFKKIVKKQLVKYWDGADNLGLQVTKSMVSLKKRCPAIGWVRADSVVDEKAVAEISRLQKENEELKKQIERVATEAPKGTEKLAQGEDLVLVHFSFEGCVKASFGYDEYNCSAAYEISWNDLFSCVAPSMIDECTEALLRSSINEFIEEHFLWEDNPEFSEFNKVRYIYITSESFDKIKVQFRALGLITLGTKKRSASDKHTYWKLTPYGDNIMNQLLAIKK